MRVVVVGANGQLGRAVMQVFPDDDVIGLDLPEIDITDPESVVGRLSLTPPDLVIHCAAMTNVDGCARDPDSAFLVNGLGTRNVALAARLLGADLLALSTNEVFDGRAAAPYDEFAATNPINPYGASKLAGEHFVRQLLPNHYIVRTAWIFGGDTSFVTKMLEIGASGRPLTIVDDEISNPTYATDLAAAIGAVARSGLYGTYHLVNEGTVSRHDYAQAIFSLAGLSPQVSPIPLASYPRASTPPAYAPLRNYVGAAAGIRLRPWQDALAEHLAARQAGA